MSIYAYEEYIDGVGWKQCGIDEAESIEAILLIQNNSLFWTGNDGAHAIGGRQQRVRLATNVEIAYASERAEFRAEQYEEQYEK